MSVLRSLVLLLGVLHVTAGPVLAKQDDACTVKTQRKPWQSLTQREQSDYIQATLCLMEAPAKNNLPGTKTRWDELQYVHIAQADYIHNVGAFLPFHRYFITVYEQLMETECGYNGSFPYWDEPADVGYLKESVLFDPDTGFGGDGQGATRCIADGPFANLTLRLKEDLGTTEYCITRNVNDCFFQMGAQENVDACYTKTSFEEAWRCLEAMPHSAGHGGVGGIMVNVKLSPGDPLFWLHHTYLDHLWWTWQAKGLPDRLVDISGPNVPSLVGAFPGFGGNQTSNQTFPPMPTSGSLGDCFPGFGGNGSFPGFGGNGSFPFPLNGTLPLNGSFPSGGVMPGMWGWKPNPAFTDYFNDGGNTTTLNHTLWSAGIFPNATIADVMDVNGPLVCAEYL